MGYELWMSPITGYRRKGTRLSELRALFAAGVQARAILEPLQCCPADAPALEMKRILEEKGFDVAGVQAKPDGPVIGYVVKDQLQGQRTSEHLLPLHAEHLVSDSTPLSEALSTLRSREHVFVVVAAGVKGDSYPSRSQQATSSDLFIRIGVVVRDAPSLLGKSNI